MKALFFVFLIGATALASDTVSGMFKVTGVVKKLDGDAVVLRVKERNIRISKRFFDDWQNLKEGEVGTAYYKMAFAK